MGPLGKILITKYLLKKKIKIFSDFPNLQKEKRAISRFFWSAKVSIAMLNLTLQFLLNATLTLALHILTLVC